VTKNGAKLVLPRLYCIVDAGCFAATPDPTTALLQHVHELIAGDAMMIQYRNKQGPPREMLSQAREIRRVVGHWLVVGEEAVGRRPSAATGREIADDEVVRRSNRGKLSGEDADSCDAGGGPGPRADGSREHARSDDVESLRQRPTTNDQRPLLIMNDRADLCLAAGFDGVHVGQDDLSPHAARRVVGARRMVGFSTHNLEQIRAADSSDCDYVAVGPVFATASKQNPDPVIGLTGLRAARAATKKPLVAIGGITRANCRQVIDAGADSVAVISDLLRNPRCAVQEFLEQLAQ
jgi:thiamine-phosphate diphosphorylase